MRLFDAFVWSKLQFKAPTVYDSALILSYARAGPESGQCQLHWSNCGAFLAHYGIFTGAVIICDCYHHWMLILMLSSNIVLIIEPIPRQSSPNHLDIRYLVLTLYIYILICRIMKFTPSLKASILLSFISIPNLMLGLHGPLLLTGLTLIATWISNYIHYKVWDKATYPFPNFYGTTIKY